MSGGLREGRRELAGLGRRSLACLIDSWFLVFLDTTVGWISLKILVGPNFSWAEPAQIDLLLTKLRLFLLPCVIFLLIVNLSYFTYLTAVQGQTLGKMLWGIQVVGLEKVQIGHGRALIRAASFSFSILPLGLGLFWALLDRRKQTWHDKVAGTLVVRYRLQGRGF